VTGTLVQVHQRTLAHPTGLFSDSAMRALIPEERAILELLLTKRFPGRDQLLARLDDVLVTGSSCSCGCDSVGLAVSRSAPQATVSERVPTDAFGRDPSGVEVGVLLHVIDGFMAELEFYSTTDASGFGRPTLDSMRLAEWSEPDDLGVRTRPPDTGPPAEH
jgi:hypothetical protein